MKRLNISMLSAETEIMSAEDEIHLIKVDSGATSTTCSVQTIERWEELGLIEVLNVDVNTRKTFRVANGQPLKTLSQAKVRFNRYPQLGEIDIDITPESHAPSLLGMNVLQAYNLNLREATLTRPASEAIRLTRCQNGHVAINLQKRHETQTLYYSISDSESVADD